MRLLPLSLPLPLFVAPGVWTGLCGVEVFCGGSTFGRPEVSPRPPPVPTLSEQIEVLRLCKKLTSSKLYSYITSTKVTALTEVSLFFVELGGVTTKFAGRL